MKLEDFSLLQPQACSYAVEEVSSLSLRAEGANVGSRRFECRIGQMAPGFGLLLDWWLQSTCLLKVPFIHTHGCYFNKTHMFFIAS